MSTQTSTHDPREAWLSRTRLVLSPIAAPSILGLYGFFGATIMVGTHLAGWWGTGSTSELFVVAPFALLFGGIAQLLAGMWAYRARDALATAVHGTWGAFWIAYGFLHLLYATGVLVPAPSGTSQPGHAMWFVVLTAITTMAAVAALGMSAGLFGVLATLAAGSGLVATGLWAGMPVFETIGGWLLVVSAALAWYAASAMMLKLVMGRTVLPTGEFSREANVPGAAAVYPIEYPAGMPGAKVGQ